MRAARAALPVFCTALLGLTFYWWLLIEVMKGGGISWVPKSGFDAASVRLFAAVAKIVGTRDSGLNGDCGEWWGKGDAFRRALDELLGQGGGSPTNSVDCQAWQQFRDDAISSEIWLAPLLLIGIGGLLAGTLRSTSRPRTMPP